MNIEGILVMEKKTEPYSFRLKASLKIAMYKRATELRVTPQQFLNDLLERELASGESELKPVQQTFIEKQFQVFSEKLLAFFADNIVDQISRINENSQAAHFFSRKALSQAAPTLDRTRELLLRQVPKEEQEKYLETINSFSKARIEKFNEEFIQSEGRQVSSKTLEILQRCTKRKDCANMKFSFQDSTEIWSQ